MAGETMRGGRIIAETLRGLGIEDFFSLPGAQTMGLYDELRRAGGIRLHTAIQDTAAVGMADGFARVTGRIAAANVYEFAGFANAVCNIYSALTDRTPLLVIGTLTDARQSGRGWSAEVPNLVGFAQQVTKLAVEVPRADRLEEMLRRAVQVATTPPFGPVYVGVPANLFIEEAPAPTGKVMPEQSFAAELAPDDAALIKVAKMILAEEQVAIVGGSDVATAGAIADLEALAEELALPVYVEPYASGMPMSAAHPNYFRVLTPAAKTYREANVVVAFGAKLAKRFSYFPFEYVLPHQRLAHFHADAAELCRAYPTEVAVLANAKVAITGLSAAIRSLRKDGDRSRVEARRARIQKAKAEFDAAREKACAGKGAQKPADAACSLREIGRALGPNDILVDELIGLRHWWPVYLDLPDPTRYLGTSAGFMGWGASAATGIGLGMRHLGRSGKAVLIAGDGCFQMAPQGLWTAAHDKAPVVFIVTNNRGWVCLKGYYDVVRGATQEPMGEERIGCDFDEPPIDYVAMAKSFGVPGRAVDSADALGPALREALAAEGPYLIDLQLEPHLKELYSYPKP